MVLVIEMAISSSKSTSLFYSAYRMSCSSCRSRGLVVTEAVSLVVRIGYDGADGSEEACHVLELMA